MPTTSVLLTEVEVVDTLRKGVCWYGGVCIGVQSTGGSVGIPEFEWEIPWAGDEHI